MDLGCRAFEHNPHAHTLLVSMAEIRPLCKSCAASRIRLGALDVRNSRQRIV